jgi:chitinase
MKNKFITPALLMISSLSSLMIHPTPTATFTTSGWQSTLTVSVDSSLDLTANPITFTVAPTGIDMTKGCWGLAGAPTSLTQSGDYVTVTTGPKWWPPHTTQHLVVNQPFSLKFSPSFTELSISNLYIGSTPVPVTNPDALLLPANADPSRGFYQLPMNGSSSPLPFAPYIDITQLSGKNLIEAVSQTGLQAVRFAFITEGGKLPGLNWGGYPLSFFSTGIHYLQSNGVKVIVSLGGEVGVFPGIATGVFYPLLEKIIQTYPGVGLCFDIEGANVSEMLASNPTGTGTKADSLMQAAVTLQKTYQTPIDITLAVLPTGLTNEGKAIVTAAKNAGLIFDVNIMAMDYGTAFDTQPFTMKDYAIAAATQTATFLQTLYPEKTMADCLKQVQITSMIGYNDVTAELFSLKDAQDLAEWAKNNNVILSMWALTRDHPSAAQDPLVSQNSSGPGVQTSDYQFTAIFNQ